MKQKHTIEEFMCWRRENLERLADSLWANLEYPPLGLVPWLATNEDLAKACVDMCYELDARETPITIVTESGGRDIDTSELT